LIIFVGLSLPLMAVAPRVLPEGQLPEDARLEPLRQLGKDYFPFQQVTSVEAWSRRAEKLRRQVQVATGIWPLPTRTPLQAVVHSPVERDEYTVWRVYFESFPGHYVTGSLYRPKNINGRLPAVLTPHGHWPEGRFHQFTERQLHEQISLGGERFIVGGRTPLQSRCVQLARMGCVVFHYDMDGVADSVQHVQHRNGVRSHMNTQTDWGLASPQAELHLQNQMGLQTWNSIRSMDFLCSLAFVDPHRIAVTGASGGGTQTFMLMAVDDRPAAAVPCVMVSTAMQGGCNCENAPYLRIGAGNIDLAALTAPRPLGLTAADDWTVELKDKGYPDLVNLYSLLGHADRLRAVFHTQFKHNYNSVNRMFMYGCINDFLGLGYNKPILERDYVPLTREEMSVWTPEHPAPSGDQVGETHERTLLRNWALDAQAQISKLRVHKDAYAKIVGGAWEVILGKTWEEMGHVEWKRVGETKLGKYRGELVLLGEQATGQQLPALVIYPSGDDVKKTVLWLTDTGKAGLLTDHGDPRDGVARLLDTGATVIGVDLLYQGEFLPAGEKLTNTRMNTIYPDKAVDQRASWEYFAGYTFGYNRPLLSRRMHDVLATLQALRNGPQQAKSLALVGEGRETGPIALAARLAAGQNVERTVAMTAGFRFASVTRFDDPMFVPGAVKYDDLEGLARLGHTSLLWLDQPNTVLAEETLISWLRQ
jgi:dienelactone hydrolase